MAKINPKVILILSIACGLLAFVMTSRSEQKAPEILQVVTATVNLEETQVISLEQVTLAPIPQGISADKVYRSIKDVEGKVMKKGVSKGQPILITDLAIKDEDIFAMIPEGYRSSTIPVNITEEVFKHLRFGIRVDVLFTDTSSAIISTKTIIRNAMVMKVSNQEEKVDPSKPTFVTLAVPPIAVESLSYAVRKGKLDVSIVPESTQGKREFYMTLKELMNIRDDILIPVKKPEIELIKGTKKFMVEV